MGTDYDPKLGALKGTRALAGTGLALTIAGGLVKLLVEQGVGIPEEYRPELVGSLAVVIAFGLEMGRNWLKQHGYWPANF